MVATNEQKAQRLSSQNGTETGRCKSASTARSNRMTPKNRRSVANRLGVLVLLLGDAAGCEY